jgi:hypothetical protein
MKDKFMDGESIKVLNATALGTASTVSGYCELISPVLSVLIGLATFTYICSKVYWINKNKGEKR